MIIKLISKAKNLSIFNSFFGKKSGKVFSHTTYYNTIFYKDNAGIL